MMPCAANSLRLSNRMVPGTSVIARRYQEPTVRANRVRNALPTFARQSRLFSSTGARNPCAPSRQLYRVSPADPVSMAGAALFLMAVAVLANLIPALRATRVNPLIALRQE